MPEPAPLLGAEPNVASAGVELFAEDLERRAVPVTRLDWRPPADGTDDALARLAHSAARIASANDESVARLQAARPILTGIGRASDLIDGMDANTILHAGPPIE
ncbi:MAG: DUF1116 domain-containing protein, partial [Actinomycetota bacterium]